MTKVLVIGASKGIGLKTVEAALAAGHDVRAFARSAVRTGGESERLESVRGDALSVDDVQKALDGMQVVIQTLGVSLGPGMVLGGTRLFSAATGILVPAMEQAGISRLIAVTGFGAGDSARRVGCLQRLPFRLVLGRVYDDKSVQEHLIRRSALDWTIVRPVILTDGPATGAYRVLDKPHEWRNGLISRADVADFLVKQIDDRSHVRCTPVIAS